MADVATFASLIKLISAKKFVPIYLLHGEEGYYIDRLVEAFENSVPEDFRDFNLYNFYALDTAPESVIDTCRSYPMMGGTQMVIVREVQSAPASYLKALKSYAENPSDTSVLVLCHRGAKASAKELTAAMTKSGGIVYESKKLNERSVANVITDILKENSLNIDPKALDMLTDHIGTDVDRLYNELQKLTIALPKGAMVTPAVVEENIGISKDYNNFELVAAIARRDYVKAITIVKHFSRDPRRNPTMPIASLFFNLFSNVLAAIYAPDKSTAGLLTLFGFKWEKQLLDIKNALAAYKPWQVIEIISEIRRFDCMTKGNGSRWDQYALLEQLIFKIVTASGKVELKA